MQRATPAAGRLPQPDLVGQRGDAVRGPPDDRHRRGGRAAPRGDDGALSAADARRAAAGRGGGRRRGRQRAWASMHQEPAVFGSEVDGAAALAAVGLQSGDGHPDLPAQVVSTGVGHLLVPVRDSSVLERCAPLPEAFTALLQPLDCATVYVAAAEPGAGRAQARAFFQNPWGLTEDPATGSAAGPLCAYLQRRMGTEAVVVDQGVAMGRPSRMTARWMAIAFGSRRRRDPRHRRRPPVAPPKRASTWVVPTSVAPPARRSTKRITKPRAASSGNGGAHRGTGTCHWRARCCGCAPTSQTAPGRTRHRAGPPSRLGWRTGP